jgi:hypothetical protein
VPGWPASDCRGNCNLYGESTAVTDLMQFANRSHSLTIDGRCRQVVDLVLGG